MDSQHHLYIIIDSTINLSKNIGVPVHWVLGSTFFRNNIVRIDYLNKILEVVFYPNHLKVKWNRYEAIPITVINERPSVDDHLHTTAQSFKNVCMLIDHGNSDPMLIFKSRIPNYDLLQPVIEDYLCQGLYGDIFGLKNRVQLVELGKFPILNPLVSYPDSVSCQDARIVAGRVGSIGNQIMAMFDIILNYRDSTIFLLKNKHFLEPYYIDMSGLEIEQFGVEWVRNTISNDDKIDWNEGKTIEFGDAIRLHFRLEITYHITKIREKSAASFVGLQIGDQLIRINGKNVGKLTLAEIRQLMQSSPTKVLKLHVRRDGLLRKFQLVDLLAQTNRIK